MTRISYSLFWTIAEGFFNLLKHDGGKIVIEPSGNDYQISYHPADGKTKIAKVSKERVDREIDKDANVSGFVQR